MKISTIISTAQHRIWIKEEALESFEFPHLFGCIENRLKEIPELDVRIIIQDPEKYSNERGKRILTSAYIYNLRDYVRAFPGKLGDVFFCVDDYIARNLKVNLNLYFNNIWRKCYRLPPSMNNEEFLRLQKKLQAQATPIKGLGDVEIPDDFW